MSIDADANEMIIEFTESEYELATRCTLAALTAYDSGNSYFVELGHAIRMTRGGKVEIHTTGEDRIVIIRNSRHKEMLARKYRKK